MRAITIVQMLVAFVVVGFGQPSFSSWLGPISAAIGYALFWRAIWIFPRAFHRFWISAFWYAFVSLLQLSWMTAIEFQGIYILFVWLIISIGVGLQFGILSILIPSKRSITISRILAMSGLWTLFEWSRYHFICGYSWNLSGLALSNPVSIQFASVFGVLGLTFWVVFTNLMGLRASIQRGGRAYFSWVVVLIVPYIFGMVHIFYHNKGIIASKEKMDCLLVQPGMMPSEKIPIKGSYYSFISPYVQWENILQHIKNYGEENLDLVVLPEAAVPFALNVKIYTFDEVRKTFERVFGSQSASFFSETNAEEKVTNAYWMQTLANILKCDLVVGLDYTDGKGKSYNSAFFVRPFDNFFDRYDKQILLPLAEYLPFQCLAPLVKFYGITDFFTPGKKSQVFKSKVPLATSICYEETFPSKIREGRLLGGQLLVNLTNDGWYPFSRLSSQHLEHARFRTVENGVSMVRSCNTGVSAAVDCLGRTLKYLEETDENGVVQKGAILAQIPSYTYATLFGLWGNFGIVFLSIVFVGVFFMFRRISKL